MQIALIVVQTLGAILTAGYEAYSLVKMAVGGIPAENALHRWDLVIVFIVFVGFVSWAIIARQITISKNINTRPHLKYVEKHETPLYAIESKDGFKIGDYLYNVLQIWFKNEPKIATDDAIAKDVIATVTFYDRTRKTINKIPTCFIIGKARDLAGNTGDRLEIIEKWSPGEICKLQIAIKRTNDENAFAFTQDGFSGRELGINNYYVKILLEGIGVINFKPLWFNMINKGKGNNLFLSNPINKPNLHREGFQV